MNAAGVKNVLVEILASDKLYSFQHWYPTVALANVASDDPSWIWQQIQFDPWLAMAVYADVEQKDAMVASCIETRKDGVLSKPRRVMPASEKRQDKKVAEFIEETLNDAPFFDQFLYEALDAVPKGVSIGEIIFQSSFDRIIISGVKFYPQHLFNFGAGELAAYSTATSMYPQTGPLRLKNGVLLDGMPFGEVLPENKFFVFSYRPQYGNRWGVPLLRKVYWPSWIKRTSVRQWLKYLEKGTGVVVARYPAGASADEKRKAIDAATALVEETAVAVPDKVTLDVHEAVRNVGSSHKDIVDDFCNSEIARAILGQTLTSRGSDGGGSRALGEVHDAVRGEKIEADAKALMAAVNQQLVQPLVTLNFGPGVKPPTWVIEYDPQADLTETANRMKVLWEQGLPVPARFYYETFQIPEPSEGEPILVKAAQPAAPSADKPQKEADFAEKKTLRDGLNNTSSALSNSKKERFGRLRPSSIVFSSE